MHLTYLYLDYSKNLAKGLLLFVQRMQKPVLFVLLLLTVCMKWEFRYILTASSQHYFSSKYSWHIHSQSHSTQGTLGCSHPQLSVAILWPHLKVLNTYFARRPLFYVCELMWNIEYTGFSGWIFCCTDWWNIWIISYLLCLQYPPQGWLHTHIHSLPYVLKMTQQSLLKVPLLFCTGPFKL